jgi:hypothetical protein
MLRLVFALSHNASTLKRKDKAFHSYRFGIAGIIITIVVKALWLEIVIASKLLTRNLKRT